MEPQCKPSLNEHEHVPPDTLPEDTWLYTLGRVAARDRAHADAVAGRVYDGVTRAALEGFILLQPDEAQRLLDNPDAFRQWLAAHA